MRFEIPFFSILFFLIGVCFNSFSQIRVGVISTENTSCDNKLLEVQSLYSKGMYFESEKLLKDILQDCNLNRARKLDVYELLIKVGNDDSEF